MLRSRNLTVAELERRIERRFGLAVDPKTLYRLASPEPVQRADLEIAGAVAAVLGIGLDDLFDVQAIPLDHDDGSGTGDLDPHQSQRLAELFDRQARGALTESERTEIEALVAEYGRRLHERRLSELAHLRGISVDEARREATARFDDALAWWHTFEDDPDGRAAVTTQARGRRRRAGR
jgi:transposase